MYQKVIFSALAHHRSRALLIPITRLTPRYDQIHEIQLMCSFLPPALDDSLL